MRKIKPIISGILAGLTISGLVSCGEKKETIQEEEKHESYVVELPIEDEKSLLEPNYEEELKSLIDNLDSETVLVEYGDLDNLIIVDQQKGEVNYDKLNEIIEVYSKIDSNFKDIMYIPSYLYNIDFNKLNIEDLNLGIYLSYPIVDVNNINTAIDKAKESTLFIEYGNEFDEESNKDILEVIKKVSEKNGNVYLEEHENYKESDVDDILANIKKEWHFTIFDILSQNDISPYLPNINAKYLHLIIVDSKKISTYEINEGTASLNIYCFSPLENGKTIYLKAPESLNDLYINYDCINKVIIEGNKNMELRVSSSNYEKLNTYIELGYFDYETFSLTAGDYTFKKFSFTNDEIELEYNGEEIGTVELKRDDAGNITGLEVIKKEKKMVRTLTKK